MHRFVQCFAQMETKSDKYRLADRCVSELLAMHDEDCRQVYLACREAVRFGSRWKDLPETLSGLIRRAGIVSTPETDKLVFHKYVDVAVAIWDIVNLCVHRELTPAQAARRLDGLAFGFLAFWMGL